MERRTAHDEGEVAMAAVLRWGWRRRAVPLLAALLLLPAAARANMAAPSFQRIAPASGAPERPAGAGLLVRQEVLTFEVGGPDCLVAAEYLVEAAAGAEVTLRFLSPPGSGGVQAWINGEARPVTTAPLDAAAPEGAAMARGLAPFEPLFQSAFTAPLQAGENRVRVAYRQEPGVFWIPRGYFRGAGYLRVFPYELWPLQGWTLAPDFHLDLVATAALPRAGFWARLFGAVPTWTLQAAGGDRALSPTDFFRGPWPVRADAPGGPGEVGRFHPVAAPVSGKLLGGSLRLEARLGADFPERLYLVLDTQDEAGPR